MFPLLDWKIQAPDLPGNWEKKIPVRVDLAYVILRHVFSPTHRLSSVRNLHTIINTEKKMEMEGRKRNLPSIHSNIQKLYFWFACTCCHHRNTIVIVWQKLSTISIPSPSPSKELWYVSTTATESCWECSRSTWSTFLINIKPELLSSQWHHPQVPLPLHSSAPSHSAPYPPSPWPQTPEYLRYLNLYHNIK